MRKILFFIIVGVGVIVATTSIPANALIFELDSVFSGTAPAGSPPWLTATFEDFATNQVLLTMSASGLTDAEFVSEWYFNWNMAGDPGIFWSFLFQPESTSPPASTVTVSEDGVPPGEGMGRDFDILFPFPTSNAVDRFGAGETAVYIIELMIIGDTVPELPASSFNVLNAAENFYTGAHVQAIGPDDEDSGKIAATESISAIPEPATILLLGAGLASLFGIRRFKFKKN